MADSRDRPAPPLKDLSGKVEGWQGLISTLATDCEASFSKTLKVVESNENAKYGVIIRKLEKRFLDWAAYLGVFAGEHASLDYRLKRHPQYRDLILMVLDMLNMSLLETTTDSSELSSDESAEDEDRHEVELDGVLKSINELDRLALQIRQIPTTSFDTRVNAFASKRPVEISSFEAKAILAINRLYPDASERLRRHLSKSMTQIHKRLLYWQSHDKKLRQDRRYDRKPQNDPIQTQRDPLRPTVFEVPLQVSVKDQETAPPKPGPSKVPGGTSFLSGTLATDPGSRFTMTPMEVKEPSPKRGGRSTVLRTKAKFPSPPRFDEEEEEIQKPCPLCRKVFLKTDFDDTKWWRRHVNEDLLPFACISSSCLPYPSFASMTEWRVHIAEKHGISLAQGQRDPIDNGNEHSHPHHQGYPESGHLEDTCPLCGNVEVEESRHTQTSIPEQKKSPPKSVYVSESTEKGMKQVRFDIAADEPEQAGEQTALPWANAQVNTSTSVTSPVLEPAVDIMMTHIAEHLQFLALLTLRLSTEYFSKGDIDALSSAEALSSDQQSRRRSTLDDFESSKGNQSISEAVFSDDDPEFSPVAKNDVPLTSFDVDWSDLFRLPVSPQHSEEGGHEAEAHLELPIRQAFEPAKPTHFAILIGIAAYPKKPLYGAVNDVLRIKEILERQVSPTIYIRTLTATADSDGNVVEPAADRPTRENLLTHLGRVKENAKSGDYLYLHYSGHGSCLQQVASGAQDREYDGRQGDLALSFLAKDSNDVYELRGRELARMFKGLANRGVTITVVLDCCFHVHHACDYDLLRQWVHPDFYALLVACGPNERTREVSVNGKSYGWLSFLLADILEKRGIGRKLRDIHYLLCSRMSQGVSPPQTPLLYGNKEQIFLGEGARENFSYSRKSMLPVQIYRNDHHLVLLAGEAHGFYTGDQLHLQPVMRDTYTIDAAPELQVAVITQTNAVTSVLNLKGSDVSDAEAWVAESQSRLGLRAFPVYLDPTVLLQIHNLRDVLLQHSLYIQEHANRPYAFCVTLDEGETEENTHLLILDSSGNRLSFCPPFPLIRTDAEDLAEFLADLVKFSLVKDLICNNPYLLDFRASFEIYIRTRSGVHYSPGEVTELTGSHDKSSTFELHFHNNGNVPLNVYICALNPVLKIDQIYGGTIDPVTATPKSGADRQYHPELQSHLTKKLRIVVPEYFRHGSSHWENIIKVFVTTHPTSFEIFQQPVLGGISWWGAGLREDGNVWWSSTAEKWDAFKFFIRTSFVDTAEASSGSDLEEVTSLSPSLFHWTNVRVSR